MVREHGEVRPRVGVSACLLGEPVRYDGGHKRQPWSEALADEVEWVRVCPEVELGLGVPRETIQLEARGDDVALVATETRRELTEAMRTWACERAEALAAEGLDGYVFKARSPSCGWGTTPVVGSAAARDGLFAEAVRRRFPSLPVADEETLADAPARETFRRKVCAHRELRALFHPGWTRGEAVDFHTKRKLLLMAHSPQAYAELGSWVGRMAAVEPEEFERRYVELFLRALGEEATPGRHANALAHAAGYFSQSLPPQERNELTAATEALGRGEGDLEALKARILAAARQFGQTYLEQQLYLAPSKSR
ncbi:MAG: DUF523 and DUF1722 domain-containing protein [Bryobacterales bacterium]